MRPSLLSAAVLPVSLWSLVAARLHHLVPEDPYAFPKYRVAFLNGLPLLNDTAQRWLQNGLDGGELEFLDQPWREDAQWRIPPVKGIEGGSQQDSGDAPAGTQVGSHPFAVDMHRALIISNFVYTARYPDLQARANENESAVQLPLSDPSTSTREHVCPSRRTHSRGHAGAFVVFAAAIGWRVSLRTP